MTQTLDRPKTNLYQASHEWATRPKDQRYLTLEELYDAVHERHLISSVVTRPTGALLVDHDDGGELYISDRANEEARARFTNYGFSQLASLISAPASYLRTLKPGMIAGLFEYGLTTRPQDTMILATLEQDAQVGQVRAFTGPKYGRIWDDQIASMLLALNQRSDGRWKVPAASYSGRDPSRATTLYASDHDLFAFLVDPDHAVEVAGEVLYRGFIVSNSETGASAFKLMCFLYRVVCDNRIIWDASEVQELIIRHTGNGPDRFNEQAVPALEEYAKGSTRKLEESILAAKQAKVADKIEDVERKLIERGFTRPAIKIGIQRAETEEGDPRVVWNLVNGITSYAKSIEYTDDRVDLERRASKLLEIAG